MVNDSKKLLSIRQLALQLTGDLPQKDWRGEIERLHRFVRDKIRYVKDIRGVETVQMPVRTLEFGQGDCDDKSTLLASLLESLGHKTRFVAIAFAPDKFSHVFVEAKLGRGWIALETTEPKPAGWRPKTPHQRMVVHN